MTCHSGEENTDSKNAKQIRRALGAAENKISRSGDFILNNIF